MRHHKYLCQHALAWRFRPTTGSAWCIFRAFHTHGLCIQPAKAANKKKELQTNLPLLVLHIGTQLKGSKLFGRSGQLSVPSWRARERTQKSNEAITHCSRKHRSAAHFRQRPLLAHFGLVSRDRYLSRRPGGSKVHC